MASYPQLGLAVLLPLAVAAAAWKAGALSFDGAAAAALVGSVVFGFGGLPAAVLLLAFFLSSSLLSAVGRVRKQKLTQEFAKDGRRDGKQVLANGSVAMVGALLHRATANPIWLAAVAGALAAAAADTWATELGVLATRRPRRLTDWRRVPAGTSGAISLEGSLAALAGAGTVAALASVMGGSLRLAIAGTVGGLAGTFLDSLLGAAVQARYYCRRCGRETERHPEHHCGQRTEFTAGWRWLHNDGVNLLATAAGAFCCLGIFGVLR